MISIVVPVYNAVGTLAECVESIVASAGDVPFELILIDDGSTDGSAELCDVFANANKAIRVLHVPNGGVSRARNIGIELADGEYICFVDSDDKVSSDYLQIIEKHSGQADITFWGFVKFDKQTHTETILTPVFSCPLSDNEEIQRTIYSLYCNPQANFFGFTWSKAFRLDIIKKYKLHFQENLKIKEDEIFTLQYCQYIKTLQVLNISLYVYTISNSSLSHSGKTEIDYEYLGDENERIGKQMGYTPLRQYLLDLSVSYKLGNVKQFIKSGRTKSASLK